MYSNCKGSLKWFAAMLVAASFVCNTGCQREGNTASESVYVFAAASLKDALETIGGRFETETGSKVFFNFSGSNVLAQQIVASSRADVFVSADSFWMDFVEENGRLGLGTRRDLLSNRLVAICAKDALWTPENGEGLCDLDFEYLCIGDPEAVPAGRYARAWLMGLKCDQRSVWEAVRERVSPSPDVRAALAQTISHSDSIGIVYYTDYLLSAQKSRVLFKAPDVTVNYPIAMTQNGLEKVSAGTFYLFLQSEESLAVFTKYGFGLSEAD